MPITSIGDMSLHFMSVRHNTQIKARLETLTGELTTGRAADLTRHLGGDRSRLADLDRRLALGEGYARVAQETGQMLSAMQFTLDAVDKTRSNLAGMLVPISTEAPPAQLASAAAAGRDAFDSMARALNARLGNTTIFAGRAGDGMALAPADLMLADLRASLTGALTAQDVTDALDHWFDAPTGGFASMAYLGDRGAALSRRIDVDQSLTLDARADNAALRDLLKASALAAVAGDSGLPLSSTVRAGLLRTAGLQLMSGAQPLALLQSRLGLAEQTIEEATVRHAAQRTAYGMMRNDLVSIDPFETATKLQQVQTQLETHYTLTARLSRLSLAEYLR